MQQQGTSAPGLDYVVQPVPGPERELPTDQQAQWLAGAWELSLTAP